MLVTITTNPLDKSSYEQFEVDDLCKFLKEKFDGVWPSSARIYHKVVARDHDVTPSCETEITRLQNLAGPFVVIVYPCDPYSFVAMIVILIVSIVMTVMMTPSVPAMPSPNRQNQSPNNELSNRTNKARPNKRIPDIYGTVPATPDLIALPYRIYENHQEVEHCLMCVGKGTYDISASYVWDDKTLVSNISGTSVEIYGPHTSPNSGHAPQLRIGDPINRPVLNVVRSGSVNGQVLRAPNDAIIQGNANIAFNYPNEIVLSPDVIDIDFTKYFQAGDPLTILHAQIYEGEAATEYKNCEFFYGYQFRFEIPTSSIPSQYDAGKQLTISGANAISYQVAPYYVYNYVNLNGVYIIDSVDLDTEAGPTYYCRITLVNPSAVNPSWNRVIELYEYFGTNIGLTSYVGDASYDLDGTYDILSVSAALIQLDSPSSVNADWADITETAYLSPKLSVTGDRWIGPFDLTGLDLTRVYANFVASNGLYKDDGYNQYPMDVSIELEITPDGEAAEYFPVLMEGTANYRTQRAVTLETEPTVYGPCAVRARRITPTDTSFAGTVVDEVKWQDLYEVADEDTWDFGDVTLVQSKTYATTGALIVKERKLNMIAPRKVYALKSDGTFETALAASSSARDIIPAICLDTRIGNRTTAELDLVGIYNTIADIETYFGTSKATEFNYTFDDDNMSFEETLSTIAQSVFCQAYRFGNLIKLFFEQATDDSSLLFNHRNKIPGSETRTISFGNVNDNDGIELEYADEDDGAIIKFYIPEDQSATNPKKIKVVGINKKLQARFLAYRYYNKLLYQNTVTEFESTQEAALLTRMERILVADNTRTGTQDGEVLAQDVLTLTLSQNVDLTQYGAYTIYLQLYDGTVESMAVTAGTESNEVVLDHATRLALVMGDEKYARTTYMISGDDEPRENAFLLVEKSPQNNMTYSLQAVNYDSRYYDNDQDYNDSVVDEDGEYL